MIACNKCGAEFELTLATIRRKRKQCKACVNEQQRAYRTANIEKWRTWPSVIKGWETYRPELKRRDYEKRKNDPIARAKMWARQTLRDAIEAKKIVRQPCEICGDKSEAHHEDYSKPFDVRWLCRLHHREHHAAERNKP